MKPLAPSPYIPRVKLARCELALVEGKEFTEFTLVAQYERPDCSMIVTTPVSLSLR
jgi:hypothetical protein